MKCAQEAPEAETMQKKQEGWEYSEHSGHASRPMSNLTSARVYDEAAAACSMKRAASAVAAAFFSGTQDLFRRVTTAACAFP